MRSRAVSRITNGPKASTNRQIGRLIQNAHCQPKWSTTTPPIEGPAADDTPLTTAQIPIADGRRSTGNAEMSRAMPAGP